MEEKEWLTSQEVFDKTGYGIYTLSDMVSKGIIPIEKTKWETGRRRFYHNSILPGLIERRKRYMEEQSGGPPKDAIEYDGFLLTPDAIRRLEAVRQRNGYRAIHWTDKSITELIAIGGDRKKTADK